MHTAPPFCKETNSLEPNHSVILLKTPRFIATKYGPSLAEVNFTGDTSICIDLHLEIYYIYIYIYIYISLL